MLKDLSDLYLENAKKELELSILRRKNVLDNEKLMIKLNKQLEKEVNKDSPSSLNIEKFVRAIKNIRDGTEEVYKTIPNLEDQHKKLVDIIKAKNLPRFINKRVQVAGWLVTGKVVHTKHGEAMEFLTFEDETGQMETTFFPKAYRRFCYLLDKSRPFLLRGRVDEDFGAVTLTVDHAMPVLKND